MLRRILRSSAFLLLATALVASSAGAATQTIGDPAGDIMPCEADVVAAGVRHEDTVTVFADLACGADPHTSSTWEDNDIGIVWGLELGPHGYPSEYPEYVIRFDASTDGRVTGQTRGRENGITVIRDWGCGTLDLAWDGARRVSVAFPRSCLGSPPWLRVEALAGTTDRSGRSWRDDVAGPTVGPAWYGSDGFWTVNDTGLVSSFGSAAFHGWIEGPLNQPIVDVAARPQNDGYWLAATDGGIFTFGNAVFHGSTGHLRLNRPIVGMATTPSGNGYWLVASDGGIFTFGDAAFHGSTGDLRLNQPIVGMAASPTGGGYWLVASDGGIFTFGDATFLGSTGDIRLNEPIAAMTPNTLGDGYWLLARDGGVFTFGNAAFLGAATQPFHNRAVGLKLSNTGAGYWVIFASGLMNHFGDAVPFNTANARGPVVGVA